MTTWHSAMYEKWLKQACEKCQRHSMRITAARYSAAIWANREGAPWKESRGPPLCWQSLLCSSRLTQKMQPPALPKAALSCPLWSIHQHSLCAASVAGGSHARSAEAECHTVLLSLLAYASSITCQRLARPTQLKTLTCCRCYSQIGPVNGARPLMKHIVAGDNYFLGHERQHRCARDEEKVPACGVPTSWHLSARSSAPHAARCPLSAARRHAWLHAQFPPNGSPLPAQSQSDQCWMSHKARGHLQHKQFNCCKV